MQCISDETKGAYVFEPVCLSVSLSLFPSLPLSVYIYIYIYIY